MTSDLAFTVFRFAYLFLLWAVVLGTISVLRQDIFGTVVTPRGKGRLSKEVKEKKRRTRGLGKAPLDNPALLITSGPLLGTSLALTNAEVIIGRSPSATLVLDDSYASSQHARIYKAENIWYVEDLGSTNGTYLDDERIHYPQPLSVGKILRIGQSTFELVNQ
ncbi:FHA domain-containing protein [Gleimia sp. 6138-11-ORH1]|uniref:FHA domain-containing protein FhaB/FipA n=1 Tax=Gleimia sp. 6138-11-ORH1 TaxID=2973937 RepID=UPI002167BFB5|nr:FHA domain-containing protein [Gleimia sp. 6138-11-ORH1]MCS4485107.1 FHA domain-containing protein [Gleimia sp. 6138-11-ORH1]